MKYCENEYCEGEAEKEVPVSEERAGDSTRWFCAACENAYTIGVQHGTFTEKASQKKASQKKQGSV